MRFGIAPAQFAPTFCPRNVADLPSPSSGIAKKFPLMHFLDDFMPDSGSGQAAIFPHDNPGQDERLPGSGNDRPI